ncbi:MAG: transporter [Verrucomicrobia bacterium]|nr:transporter [Verrucomicrobiota bacterium]
MIAPKTKLNAIQQTTNVMKTGTKPRREGGRIPSISQSRRLATAILALTILGPIIAPAQIPPRFYWKSLAGANAVPVIFQSLSGNANPIDPAFVVSPNSSVDATVAIAGYAKMLPVFNRTLTLAVLEPMGRISGETTVAGKLYNQDATGFGDPMVEVGLNLIGPKAIRSIPDLVRYEPKLSLDLIVDVAFPIGEYDNDQALNLGQNRWYGRVGAPIVWQIGPWVPGRRTTLELLPSVWFFSDNNDYYAGQQTGQTLSTDPMFQLEAHLTRDFTEHFWGSLDSTYMAGGKWSVNGVGGDSLNNLGVGLTLGYQINDNISLTAGYMATVNDSDPGDLRMDGFRISFTYGWHKIVEGQKRLKSE